MQDYVGLDDNEGIGLLAVYAFATSTGPEHNKHQITTHNLIDEKSKYLYCLQASSTFGLPKSM